MYRFLPSPTNGDANRLAPLQGEDRSRRFAAIDALRGVAAMAVVLDHLLLMSPYGQDFTRVISVEAGMQLGAGVEVFFVISGFVIAYSLRHGLGGWRAAGNFAVRRQIRLDPAYWTVLLLVVVAFAWGWLPERATDLPPPEVSAEAGGGLGGVSLWAVLGNMVYMQKLAGLPQVLEVAWTLCIEVQFYLVFMGMVLGALWLPRLIARLADRLGGRFGLNRVGAWMSGDRLLVGGTFGLGLLSLAFMAAMYGLGVAEGRNYGPIFACHWFHFAAGACCYWALAGRCGWGWCIGLLVAMLAFAGLLELGGYSRMEAIDMVVGIGTVMLIAGLGLAGQLETLGRAWVLQFLGKQSYGLYLVHLPVGVTVMTLGHQWSGAGMAWAVLWLGIGIAASLVASMALHRWVEVPSMVWAAKLKRERNVDSDADGDAGDGDEANRGLRLVDEDTESQRLKAA